jgi:hypothetical protein
VHPAARLRVGFQRTLRIPDDDKTYPLPPGLGRFPLRHVDDHAARVPKAWLKHGGVMLPMYQSEALWVCFDGDYPMAVKIATGKVNAVSGQTWKDKLNRNPQDYVVASEQPWLDGYCVEKGVIRQFVAMPLGSGYSAEEQLLDGDHWGGLRIAVYPMKRARFEKLFPELPPPDPRDEFDGKRVCYSPCCESSMGLGAGGRMRQEVYEDRFKITDWDRSQAIACHLHIANSFVWHAATGSLPPTPPITAEEYDRYGLPWFEYYDDTPALEGAKALKKLKSIAQLDKKKGIVSLPGNTSTGASQLVSLGPLRGKLKVKE